MEYPVRWRAQYVEYPVRWRAQCVEYPEKNSVIPACGILFTIIIIFKTIFYSLYTAVTLTLKMVSQS